METENITSASTFICSEAESTSTTEEKPSLSNKSSTEFSENARPAPTQPWKQWKSLVEKNNDGPWVGWQPEPDKGVQKPWLDWIRRLGDSWNTSIGYCNWLYWCGRRLSNGRSTELAMDTTFEVEPSSNTS
ncbi:uncharacterized protein BDZ99DRAFT_76450 [Mytilinidion resinicola]|uniref:Uncharacterized protein n=1 Tax=Mytilinidion resinicola TaxID=574789 RepID=A0A6A6YF64_9PEZI|nr:uncharacterized protein BDZ99DRAFT_76450 [Mytilinidion resinicola]KAF2807218.1 hypothetical protein BDZ99DRAFT_76450 [Mytilinidion resinicola]